MKNIKVLVLGGGYSPEREVSIRSAENVLNAVQTLGYEFLYFDTLNLRTDTDKFIEIAKKYDVVLPILHGIGGEDGYLQNILEQNNLKFLGSGSRASKLAFDKFQARNIMQESGLDVPIGELVDRQSFDKFIKRHESYVLKPVEGGSSIDTLIVRHNSASILSEVNQLFKKYPKMLIEELIEGQEVTVPILNEKALPPILIVPPEGKEFDYDNKYNGATSEICPIPENIISKNLSTKVMDVALKVHQVVGARHLSRVDMIISHQGHIKVLEINTIPGMTSQSLFPKSAKVVGLDFNELVKIFVESALGDR